MRISDWSSDVCSSDLDWTMLVIALISVVLLAWITFWDVPEATQRKVILADYAICALFAVEFLWRWGRSGEGWRFPARYWYEVLGMIPVSPPAFRSFRLLRIVIFLARLGRAAHRASGARVTAEFLRSGERRVGGDGDNACKAP